MNVVDDGKVSDLLARGQSVCLNLFPLIVSAGFVHRISLPGSAELLARDRSEILEVLVMESTAAIQIFPTVGINSH